MYKLHFGVRIRPIHNDLPAEHECLQRLLIGMTRNYSKNTLLELILYDRQQNILRKLHATVERSNRFNGIPFFSNLRVNPSDYWSVVPTASREIKKESMGWR